MKKYLLFGVIASVFAINAFALSKTVTTQRYVDTAVATKQNILSGYSGYAVTLGDSPGTNGSRHINEYNLMDTSDTSLPTSGLVVRELNNKQDILNAPANSVVTYTGTAGGSDSRGIYQASGSYSSQTNSLAEAQHVNAAMANAFNALVTCNTYDTSGVQTAEHCLLWNVNTLSGTYMPENQ